MLVCTHAFKHALEHTDISACKHRRKHATKATRTYACTMPTYTPHHAYIQPGAMPTTPTRPTSATPQGLITPIISTIPNHTYYITSYIHTMSHHHTYHVTSSPQYLQSILPALMPLRRSARKRSGEDEAHRCAMLHRPFRRRRCMACSMRAGKRTCISMHTYTSLCPNTQIHARARARTHTHTHAHAHTLTHTNLEAKQILISKKRIDLCHTKIEARESLTQ